jgi:hypothetical protein
VIRVYIKNFVDDADEIHRWAADFEAETGQKVLFGVDDNSRYYMDWPDQVWGLMASIRFG